LKPYKSYLMSIAAAAAAPAVELAPVVDSTLITAAL
jgi:hypothetical protein